MLSPIYQIYYEHLPGVKCVQYFQGEHRAGLASFIDAKVANNFSKRQESTVYYLLIVNTLDSINKY